MKPEDILDEDTEQELDPAEELDADDADTPDLDAPEGDEDESNDASGSDDDGADDDTAAEAEDDDTQDTEADDNDASLANEQQEEDKQKAPVDYEARFKGSQRSWQKEREARMAAEKRLAEQEQRLREIEEARQAKEVENLDPWNPRSPQHAQFNKTLEKFDLFKQALSRASDDEARQAVQAAFQPMFSEEETLSIQRHQEHLAHVQRRLATPEGQMEYIDSLVKERLNQEFEARQAAVNQTQEFEKMRDYYAELYAREENKAILASEENRQEFIKRLQSMGDNPPPDAVELVLENMRYRAAHKELPSKLANAKKSELSAREQKRLAKGRAKTERDQGISTRPIDPVKEAKRICAEQGIQWGSNKAFQVLDEISTTLSQ